MFKGIYGLDHSLVDMFSCLEGENKDYNLLAEKLKYYSRLFAFDPKGYLQDLKTYCASNIKDEKVKIKITQMLSQISAEDFLKLNFKKFNLTKQEIEILKEIHSNFSKQKSSNHYDRQKELLAGKKISAPTQLTIQDIENLHINLQNYKSLTINWEMSFHHCVLGVDKYRMQEAEQCYQYCKTHNKKMRALGMVYPTSSPTFDVSNLSKADVVKLFDGYMKTLSQTCPEIDCMDILNELSFDFNQAGKQGKYPADSPLLNNCFWQEKLGEHYYVALLDIARKYFPHSEFIYNDFGHENLEKAENIFKIIKNIQAYERATGKKLLDGIGLQCRLDSNNTKIENLQIVIDRARELGLKVQITELDVVKMSVDDGNNLISDAQSANAQAEIYKKVVELAYKNSDVVESVTYGDMSDKLSWSASTDRYIGQKSPSPTIYDENGNPKPEIVKAILDGKYKGLEMSQTKEQ